MLSCKLHASIFLQFSVWCENDDYVTANLGPLRVQANVAMAVPKTVTKTIKAAALAAPITMKVISKFGLNASPCSEWT